MDPISNGGDTVYMESYENLEVHDLMLRDAPRTRAHAQFISDNQEMFIDRVVIDVGAGTGILSLFAAKAGARHVFAVEASNTSQLCSELVLQNSLQDRITVLHGRVEDIQLPNNIKADILISEWMGFYLLHESMLHSVIDARDRFLSPDGVMVPSAASLYVCPVSMKQHYDRNVTYWTNFYGFDFSPLSRAIKKARSSQPCITTLSQSECLAEPRLVVRLDLAHVGVEDVAAVSTCATFSISRHDVLRGFACWFDVEFNGPRVSSVLSTAPGQPETHWAQTSLLLPDALLVSRDDEITCRLVISRDDANARRYNITVEVPDDDDDEGEEKGRDMGGGDDDMMVDRYDEVQGADGELRTIIRNVMTKQT